MLPLYRNQSIDWSSKSTDWFLHDREHWSLMVTEQKQPPEDFYKKSCSETFRYFHRKTPVLESIFNKIAGLVAGLQLRRLQHRCFTVKNFKNAYFQEHLQTTTSDWRCRLTTITELIIIFIIFFITLGGKKVTFASGPDQTHIYQI